MEEGLKCPSLYVSLHDETLITKSLFLFVEFPGSISAVFNLTCVIMLNTCLLASVELTLASQLTAASC